VGRTGRKFSRQGNGNKTLSTPFTFFNFFNSFNFFNPYMTVVMVW
jgi:hypothetical protein